MALWSSRFERASATPGSPIRWSQRYSEQALVVAAHENVIYRGVAGNYT